MRAFQWRLARPLAPTQSHTAIRYIRKIGPYTRCMTRIVLSCVTSTKLARYLLDLSCPHMDRYGPPHIDLTPMSLAGLMETI